MYRLEQNSRNYVRITNCDVYASLFVSLIRTIYKHFNTLTVFNCSKLKKILLYNVLLNCLHEVKYK